MWSKRNFGFRKKGVRTLSFLRVPWIPDHLFWAIFPPNGPVGRLQSSGFCCAEHALLEFREFQKPQKHNLFVRRLDEFVQVANTVTGLARTHLNAVRPSYVLIFWIPGISCLDQRKPLLFERPGGPFPLHRRPPICDWRQQNTCLLWKCPLKIYQEP